MWRGECEKPPQPALQLEYSHKHVSEWSKVHITKTIIQSSLSIRKGFGSIKKFWLRQSFQVLIPSKILVPTNFNSVLFPFHLSLLFRQRFVPKYINRACDGSRRPSKSLRDIHGGVDRCYQVCAMANTTHQGRALRYPSGHQAITLTSRYQRAYYYCSTKAVVNSTINSNMKWVTVLGVAHQYP